MYSNCCCSCSFELEIIKIGLSSHKMYSNNIMNFQEFTTILNAFTKKLETYWRHHTHIHIYIDKNAYNFQSNIYQWRNSAHTHTHIYIYIYIYTYICTLNIYVWIYIYIWIYTFIYIYIYISTLAETSLGNQIISWNVKNNVLLLGVSTLLPLMLQCMDPINSRHDVII